MSMVGGGVEIKNIGCPFFTEEISSSNQGSLPYHYQYYLLLRMLIFTEETARAELAGIRGPYHIKPHQKV